MTTLLELKRREHNLTQLELAVKAGVHPSFISAVERGLRKPSEAFCYKVSMALNVTETELFHDDGTTRKAS